MKEKMVDPLGPKLIKDKSNTNIEQCRKANDFIKKVNDRKLNQFIYRMISKYLTGESISTQGEKRAVNGKCRTSFP